MSDILGPEEVDELRPANEPKYLMMGTNTWRLIQTIDALVEALLLADRATEDCPDPKNCACRTAYWLRSGSRARVTAWLEET